MTKSFAAVLAVKALIAAALPGADVIGLDDGDEAPDRIPPNGRVVVHYGNPGEPEIDLSPVEYHYDHQIPVSVDAYQTSDPDLTSAEVADGMVEAISQAIEADRTAGGVLDYLDGYAPESDELFTVGAKPIRNASIVLIASYSTPHPLGA